MKPLYIETSALLRALLDDQDDVLEVLGQPRERLASILTFVEAERVLAAKVAEHELSRAKANEVRDLLTVIRAGARLMSLDAAVVDRAFNPFPVEPIRALDAFHVASAELYRMEVGDLEVLSTDKRVRDNAAALGMQVSNVRVERPGQPKKARKGPKGKKARSMGRPKSVT